MEGKERDDVPSVIFNGINVTPQSLTVKNTNINCSINSVPLLKSGIGMNSYNSSSLENLISLELLAQGPTTYTFKDSKKDVTPTRFVIDNEMKDNDQLFLTETEVFTSFNMPGAIFANDFPKYDAFKESNQSNRADDTNSRRRIERSTQTFSSSVQTSGTSTSFKNVHNVGCGDDKLIDSNVENARTSMPHDNLEAIINALFKTNDSQLDVSEGIPIYQLIENEALHDNCEEKVDMANAILSNKLKAITRKRILHSPNLPMKLTWMERALHQIYYYKEQLHYRAIPVGNEAEIKIVTSSSKVKKKEDFQRLFRCRCDQSSKRAVTSLCWNKFNADILAAGYSSCKADNRRDGKVMLWSITNSFFPENIINTWSSITTIDYSNVRPAILAVGMSDGTIAVFDTSKKDANRQLIVDSVNTKHRNVAAISQVKWIDTLTERGERLISISLDGRILEWYIQKGFCFNALMLLKRITTSNEPLNRTACGLCFDFPKRQTTSYVVACEDGHIYECSTSYNEQHLSAFKGHEGPVTQIKCSPFLPHVFLSCSNDWTVKLWSISNEDKNALLEFHSMDLFDTVNDLCWSNTNSTSFALVASDGRVEIWDLNHCKLNPLLKYPNNLTDQEERLTLLFGKDDKCLVTGNKSGDVEIFRLNVVQNSGLHEETEDDEEEAKRLNDIISKKGDKAVQANC